MTLAYLVGGVMTVTAVLLIVSGRLRVRVSGEKGQAIALGCLVAALVGSVASNAFQIDNASRLNALERPSPQAVEVTLQGSLRECLEQDPPGRACRAQLVQLLERGLRERQRAKRREKQSALRRESVRRLAGLLRSRRLTDRPRRTRGSRRTRPAGKVRARQRATPRTTRPRVQRPIVRQPVPVPRARVPVVTQRPARRRNAPPTPPARPPRDTSKDAERRQAPAPPPSPPPPDPSPPPQAQQNPGEAIRRTPPPPPSN